jgi:pimaricinolide synthase PimS1
MREDSGDLLAPWIVTGADPEDLRTRARRLRDRLDQASDAELDAISAELLAERPRRHRVVFLGGRRDRLRAQLDAVIEAQPSAGAILGAAREPARVAFIFCPIRTEYEGMILDLLPASPTFRRWMNDCEAALEPHADWSLDDVLRGRPDTPSIYQLDVCQHALFATCTSLARLWEAFGVRPDAVLGHSFGEVPAATISGALNLPEAARVISTWGRSGMRFPHRGEMAVVALSAAELADRIEPWSGRLWISALTGPTSTSVSGEKQAVDEMLTALAAEGIGGRAMGISVPTHSPAVRVIYSWCDEELRGLKPRPGKVPFYSGVVGHAVDQTGLDSLYWASNLAQQVHFEAAVREVLKDGFDILVEVGPRRVLAEQLHATAAAAGVDAVIVGTLEQGDSTYLLRALATLFVNGVEVDWAAVCGARPEIPIAFWSGREDVPEENDGERLRALLAAAPAIEHELIVLTLVRDEVAKELGAADVRAVDPDRPFKDLGFDSAKAVNLRNRLTEATGLALDTTVAFDYPTPRDVARKLLSEADGEAASTKVAEVQQSAIDELDLDGLIALTRQRRETL